jgi:Spy/CpxP family protein refolding chaperone
MIDAKLVVLAMAAGGASLVGLGAIGAQAHGAFRGRHDHAMLHRFVQFAIQEKLAEVGASEVQKQKVEEVTARLFKQGKELHGDRGELHAKLLALLEQDQPDAAQLKAMVRERTDALTRFADEATDAVLELHAVFTPEQRRQLLAALREHMEAHHRR